MELRLGEGQQEQPRPGVASTGTEAVETPPAQAMGPAAPQQLPESSQPAAPLVASGGAGAGGAAGAPASEVQAAVHGMEQASGQLAPLSGHRRSMGESECWPKQPAAAPAAQLEQEAPAAAAADIRVAKWPAGAGAAGAAAAPAVQDPQAGQAPTAQTMEVPAGAPEMEPSEASGRDTHPRSPPAAAAPAAAAATAAAPGATAAVPAHSRPGEGVPAGARSAAPSDDNDEDVPDGELANIVAQVAVAAGGLPTPPSSALTGAAAAAAEAAQQCAQHDRR